MAGHTAFLMDEGGDPAARAEICRDLVSVAIALSLAGRGAGCPPKGGRSPRREGDAIAIAVGMDAILLFQRLRHGVRQRPDAVLPEAQGARAADASHLVHDLLH